MTLNITNQSELFTYIRQSLGEPQIKVELLPCQLIQAIDDSIRLFNDISGEFCELQYFKHQITQLDLDANQFDISSLNLLDIYDVYAFNSSSASGSGFINNFQGELSQNSNPINPINTATYNHVAGNAENNMDMFGSQLQGQINLYWQSVNLNEINSNLFNNKNSASANFRYNKYTKILNIDSRFDELIVGNFILIHGTHSLDSDTFSDIYNNVTFRNLCVANSKRIWGMTLGRKYQNSMILGGVSLNGDELYRESVEEIDKLKSEISDLYSGVMGIF